MKIIIYILFLLVLYNHLIQAQSVPAVEENIPYLVTFGGNAETSWGDDDFCQVFFCFIPELHVEPVYIRVYDPDIGASLDELKGNANSTVSFSVYGGNGCWSDSLAQVINNSGEKTSGYLMATKTFGNETEYDKKWYTFGPFNPYEGEYSDELGGRVLKIIAKGLTGDDGNIYRYFLSSVPNENKAVEGGNFFTYKYHFRLPDDQSQVCQIYPFVDDKTILVEILNFDWDNDGVIRFYSVAKNGLNCKVSGSDSWAVDKIPIVDEEKNSTVEIRFVKNKSIQMRNNNVVIAVRNQYGISLPFYVVPIGGAPVYKPKIKMR